MQILGGDELVPLLEEYSVTCETGPGITLLFYVVILHTNVGQFG